MLLLLRRKLPILVPVLDDITVQRVERLLFIEMGSVQHLAVWDGAAASQASKTEAVGTFHFRKTKRLLCC